VSSAWWEKIDKEIPKAEHHPLYQSYLKFRSYVGWVFVEEWWTWDRGKYVCASFRERLYCEEVK